MQRGSNYLIHTRIKVLAEPSVKYNLVKYILIARFEKIRIGRVLRYLLCIQMPHHNFCKNVHHRMITKLVDGNGIKVTDKSRGDRISTSSRGSHGTYTLLKQILIKCSKKMEMMILECV